MENESTGRREKEMIKGITKCDDNCYETAVRGFIAAEYLYV
jgi:hypothetical protein